MVSSFDVLGHGLVGHVHHKVDGTLSVTVKLVSSCWISSSLMKSFIEITSLQPSTSAIYSASVFDSVTDFYSLDCHDTDPAWVITYQDGDQLVSTSANISEAVKPSSKGLP